jgi:hypothetical protein
MKIAIISSLHLFPSRERPALPLQIKYRREREL